ncbi:MAG: hypothetical protein ACYCPA_10265 [Acidithiobacillus sp.]
MIIAESAPAPEDRQILHATFRRSGRSDAEQGFDIDYYDLHWLPHNRAFDSLGALEDQLVAGLRALEADHARVKSIAGWEYLINSISNAI